MASMGILVMGMVFTSASFPPGTVGYMLLTVVSAVVILGSTGAFAVLLVFEVYRSVKVRSVPSLCLEAGVHCAHVYFYTYSSIFLTSRTHF